MYNGWSGSRFCGCPSCKMFELLVVLSGVMERLGVDG